MLAAPAAADSLSDLAVPDLRFQATDGESYAIKQALGRAPLSVFTFFSASCPCQRAHDARLKELAEAYRARGVQFFAVDSEAGSTLAKDREEAKARQYGFPILRDEQGELAKALRVRFATGTVIVDSRGKVHYRGGIDQDKRQAKPGSRFFLREALDHLIAGAEPDPAEPKALGCFLRGR
jgi:peroxiredoxin